MRIVCKTSNEPGVCEPRVELVGMVSKLLTEGVVVVLTLGFFAKVLFLLLQKWWNAYWSEKNTEDPARDSLLLVQE